MAYLHSYRATLSFLAQTFLIAAVVRHPRFTEENTARLAIILGVGLKYAEVLNRDRLVFLLGTTPMIVATFSLFDASLQGIYTDSIPSSAYTYSTCMLDYIVLFIPSAILLYYTNPIPETQ